MSAHPIPSVFRGGIPVIPLLGIGFLTLGTCLSQTLYNFGNPGAEEQLYIEFINRARANPPAEGARLAATTDPAVLFNYSYYGVNLTTMQSEFNALPALPPLAPNAKLMATSRSHSAWMLASGIQDHDEPTNTFWDRISDAGYDAWNGGENINAYSINPWHGHAGFEVDWGPGGMQDGRGHRANIHNSGFNEIGVGVVFGINSSVTPAIGPQLVTQDFGTQFDELKFGTGVAYYDLNANNFYDLGEGISDLTVNVSGVSTDYCKTAIGGGWVVPVPITAGNRTVTFSGPYLSQAVNLTVPASGNAKADLKLAYNPPTITSPSTGTDGTPQNFTFTATGGATGYTWKRSSIAAAPAENCESTSGITSVKTGTYAVLNTNIKQQGGSSFHLVNATGANQSLELNTVYFGNASPSISFQSRLATSWPSERYKMQVKEEGTVEWQDAYSQTGSTTGESVFTQRSASLTQLTGKAFRVRFVMNFSAGIYGSAGENGTGWFIDAITFTNISALSGTVSQSLAGTSAAFTPTTGTHLLSVAPVISGREFPSGYQILTVSSGAITTPAINTHPASVPVVSGGSTTFNVSATGGSLSYQWYSGSSGNKASPISGATASSYTTPALGSNSSCWVCVSNSAGNANSNTATATVLNPVFISSHPASTNIASGSATMFSVSATGSSPTYQWYSGNTGNTANPISGATSNSFTTPSLSATTSYWVRVSNAVSAADSATATANVFIAPAITTHPASANVASGSTKTFSVVASGTAPIYQWYSGNSGDLSNPISGATSSSYTTPALTSTTSYWVRVSNLAGNANSNTATATVVIPPVILSQPVSTTIKRNTSTTLSVVASGPLLTYQWYQGTAPSTTTQLSGATASSYTTASLGSGKSYWVKVSNSAGNVNSMTAVISTTTGTITRNFGVWASEIETANSITAGTLSNGNGDYDKDGLANLIEYAFGGSPIIANDAAPRMPAFYQTASECFLQYQLDTTITDITVTPVATSNLTQWFAPGASGAPAGFTSVTTSTSGNIQTRKAAVPKSTSSRCLLRVQVTRP